MLHFSKNGAGWVTPNYLYTQSGVVPHPLQSGGQVQHLGSGFLSGSPIFGGGGSPLTQTYPVRSNFGSVNQDTGLGNSRSTMPFDTDAST